LPEEVDAALEKIKDLDNMLDSIPYPEGEEWVSPENNGGPRMSPESE